MDLHTEKSLMYDLSIFDPSFDQFLLGFQTSCMSTKSLNSSKSTMTVSINFCVESKIKSELIRRLLTVTFPTVTCFCSTYTKWHDELLKSSWNILINDVSCHFMLVILTFVHILPKIYSTKLYSNNLKRILQFITTDIICTMIIVFKHSKVNSPIFKHCHSLHHDNCIQTFLSKVSNF